MTMSKTKHLSKGDRLDRLIRRLRNSPRLWDADDIYTNRIGKLQVARRKERENEPDTQPRGPYSGMTRRELAQTRTCEPDWY